MVKWIHQYADRESEMDLDEARLLGRHQRHLI